MNRKEPTQGATQTEDRYPQTPAKPKQNPPHPGPQRNPDKDRMPNPRPGEQRDDIGGMDKPRPEQEETRFKPRSPGEPNRPENPDQDTVDGRDEKQWDDAEERAG